MNSDKSPNSVEQTEQNEQNEVSDAPQTGRLTIEVPTEIEAGRAPTCTCPPGCCC